MQIRIYHSFFVPNELPTKQTITVFHQNIAGILSKRDYIEVAISNIKKEIGDIDVLCFTETFLKKGSESNIKINNYKLANFFSRINEKRGGSCIFIKNNIDFVPISVQNSKINEFECCAIKLTSCNLIIICIYRTPSSSAYTFLQELDILLNTVAIGPKKQIILCGDFNIDMMKETKYSKKLISVLSNYNLTNHVTKPTRQKSCIDLVVSNLQSVETKLLCLGLSDHENAQIVMAQVRVTSQKLGINDYWFEKRRDLGNENINKFVEAISSLTFKEIYDETDTETAFNKFHELLTLFYDLCFPFMTIRVTHKNIKKKWMTKNIRRCCIRKRCLYLKYHLSKSKPIKTVHKRNYRT